MSTPASRGGGRGRGRGRVPDWAPTVEYQQGMRDDEALALALRLSEADAAPAAPAAPAAGAATNAVVATAAAQSDGLAEGGGAKRRDGGAGRGVAASGDTQDVPLAAWAARALAPLVGSGGGGGAPDPSVLAEILISLETDGEVRQYCLDFLGEGDATSCFATEFCNRRSGVLTSRARI